MKYLFGTVCIVCAAYLLGKGESYWGVVFICWRVVTL